MMSSTRMSNRILVVDDDVSVRESLRKVLKDDGYEVRLASDGLEALAKFEAEPVDLLVLDIGLPLKNGWDTFERITNQDPVLPIIIITGQADQYDMAVAAGVGALMEKPLDAPRLLQTIQELLAEPREARLRRLCGLNQSTRHVPSASALFLRTLQKRYRTPVRYSKALRQNLQNWTPDAMRRSVP
jgi:DNA-binding response OmpR family regulator